MFRLLHFSNNSGSDEVVIITTDLDADADDYAPAGLTLDNDIKCEALVGDIYGLPCEYELRKS